MGLKKMTADELRPSPAFSRAGKASAAVLIGQAMFSSHEHSPTKADDSLTEKPAESRRDESVDGPHAHDRGRGRVISSSPRLTMEAEMNQNPGAKLLVSRELGDDEPSELVLSFLAKVSKDKAKPDESKAKSLAKEIKPEDVEHLFAADSEEIKGESDHTRPSIGQKHSGEHGSSAFLAPDRWKHFKKFDPPPVGHYRPRETITTHRVPEYDFGLHESSPKKDVPNEPNSPSPEAKAGQEFHRDAHAPNSSPDHASSKITDETGRFSPSKEFDYSKSKSPKKRGKHSADNEKHFMPLPKSNMCASSFKSKSPQRFHHRTYTPEPYSPSIDVVRQSAPSFTFPKDRQYLADGRPSTAPPPDLAAIPHGSAYDVSFKFVKPSMPSVVPMDKRVSREKWSAAKTSYYRKVDLEPTKPPHHIPSIKFDRMPGRSQVSIQKDMIDSKVDPVYPYSPELVKDLLGHRTPSPNLKKALPRKPNMANMLDQVYEIQESKLYHSRISNVHDFGKAPGHKELNNFNAADVMYDAFIPSRHSPSPDMTRQVPRDKAIAISTREKVTSLDVIYDPEWSTLLPRVKGDPMIERQLSRSPNIF